MYAHDAESMAVKLTYEIEDIFCQSHEGVRVRNAKIRSLIAEGIESVFDGRMQAAAYEANRTRARAEVDAREAKMKAV
jgi:hypothetical protein